MRTQFSIRLNEEDKEKIAEIAKKNSRTMNGQIEFIIKTAIADYEKVNGKLGNKNN